MAIIPIQGNPELRDRCESVFTHCCLEQDTREKLWNKIFNDITYKEYQEMKVTREIN